MTVSELSQTTHIQPLARMNRMLCYIFSQGDSLYFFSLLIILWRVLGVGILGLGPWIGFLGLGFSVDGVWCLWCEAFLFFLGVGALGHRKITQGKNGAGETPKQTINFSFKASINFMERSFNMEKYGKFCSVTRSDSH